MKSEPKRILLCVTGLSPQIVTETLYALAHSEPRWIPDEIHLVTTLTGKESARLNLLLGKGWFHQLCTDYELSPIAFSEENIHVPVDATGKSLEDIRSPDDNSLVADFITEQVRQLTVSDQTELHVSIAGGRKTMGYYMGYALSLYGRPQDRLSHVLVSDPYESNRDFYYPTPYDFPIHVSRGSKEYTVDAKNAKVELAEIPFVRLREGLHPRLKEGNATFSQVIDMANRAQAEPRLILDVAQKCAWMDDEFIELSPTEFGLLYWLAERVRQDDALTAWSDHQIAEEFIKFVEGKPLYMDGIREAIAVKMKADKLGSYFSPHKSRIEAEIYSRLGNAGVRRYAIQSGKEGGQSKFHLPLEPHQIEIRKGITVDVAPKNSILGVFWP